MPHLMGDIDLLVWTDWPARRRPARAIAAATLILASVFVFMTVNFVYGVVAAFVLMTVSAEILLPTRFSLSADGVEAFNIFRHARRPWARFHGWRKAEDGFYLAGRAPMGFLARRRSLWLPCPDLQDEVASLLETHLQEAA